MGMVLCLESPMVLVKASPTCPSERKGWQTKVTWKTPSDKLF